MHLKGCRSKKVFIQSGNRGSGTITPESKTVMPGSKRLTPSPETVQKAVVVASVVMLEETMEARQKEAPKNGSACQDTGALSSKKIAEIRRMGTPCIRAGIKCRLKERINQIQ